MKRVCLLMTLVCMMMVSCKPEPEKLEGPVVITAEVTEINLFSAVCGGEVVSGGDAVIVARGVCYNTTGTPTVSDIYTMDGTNIGSFTSILSSLELNTTYYVRAYATDAKGVTSYGEEVSFITLDKLLPVVTTAEVTDIRFKSATCGGEVTFDGNVSVTARGICWGTSPNPTIEKGNKINNGSGTGSFKSYMSGLKDGTTYYVRAYATNEVGTAYGEEVCFTTNGYEYVDLGLSVKWATCNVGATSPEEYGDYFAWGETTTKDTYSTSNCPTYGLSISELRSQGYIDSEGNLTSQYDAATANWGGSWRMPTREEQEELLNNCTWTWTTQNGVNGYKVTGSSGASIFLPAAGFRYGSSLYDAGSDGGYWSSTSDAVIYDINDEYYYYDEYNAFFLRFDISMECNGRCGGHSVRPVLE